jgi:hypothetical protein
MPSTTTVSRAARAARHTALTTALAVCAVIGALSLVKYQSAVGELHRLTARSTGKVTATEPGAATVEWAGPRLTVPISGSTPPVGTPTEVAYDPADPANAIIPGAAVLTAADRSRDGVLFTALVAAMVLLTDAWLLITRRTAAHRLPSELKVRRITMRKGLLTRTWLETDHVWIPVYFEPELLMLPAPTTVTAHGNPAQHRLIAVDLPDGRTLYPSGRTRTTEPPGRRTDSPTHPDAYTETRARTASRWRNQLWVDAALVVPAPLIGALWAYLDNGGIMSWLAATALTGAAALWWAAIRGSDPT